MEVFDWGTGQSVDGNFKIVDSLLGENQTNYSNLILGVYKSHSDFFFLFQDHEFVHIHILRLFLIFQ